MRKLTVAQAATRVGVQPAELVGLDGFGVIVRLLEAAEMNGDTAFVAWIVDRLRGRQSA